MDPTDELRLARFSLERSADSIFWIGEDGAFLYVNGAACRELGHAREALLNLSVHDIDPNYSPAVWAEHWGAVKAAGTMSFESVHHTASGGLVPVDISSDFVSIEDTELVCAFARDISERKRMEGELLRRLAVEELVTDISKRFIAAGPLDTDLEILRALEATGKLMELDVAALLLFDAGGGSGQSYVWPHESAGLLAGEELHPTGAALSPDDEALVPAIELLPWAKRTLGKGKIIRLADIDRLPRTASKDREQWESRHIQGLVCLPMSPGGELVGAFICASREPRDWQDRDVDQLRLICDVFTNVVGKERAERALHESERRLAGVFEAADDVSFIITSEDEELPVILEFSKGAEKVFGYTREEALGRPVSMFHTAQSFERALGGHLRMIAGRRGFAGTTTLVRKSGETFPAIFSNYPLLDEEGHMYASVGVSLDITERKALEEQLRQSQKMEGIGRLAGGVAHDFNNLLTPILGYAELGLAEASPGSALHDDLEAILEAANKAADVTKRLLVFSCRQLLTFESVDLNVLADEFASLLCRIVGERIDVRLELRRRPLIVNGDASQLQQVLMNLAVNARDAMPDGGLLTIHAGEKKLDADEAEALGLRGAGTYGLLEVIDTGIGMDEETRSHVFEPFFTTGDRATASGLGLSTVYGIVRQHGGAVAVESSPGEGSRFTVYLLASETREQCGPVKKAAVAQAGTAQADVRAKDGLTVLVVEDEPVVRRLVCDTLALDGYQLMEAGDGKEALALAAGATAPPDLLLTDVIMPGMNGRELRDRLGASCPGLRTLFMSGYAENVIVHQGVLEPGVDLLQKPFTARALLERVQAAFEAGTAPERSAD